MKLQIIQNTHAQTESHNTLLPVFINHLPNLEQLGVLTQDNEAEVLTFLKVRPVHTVVMTSFIQDNGIEGKDNRGKYFGYRNQNGKLEGVALIGHTTLIESRSDESLAAFAIAARAWETPIHIMMSDGKTIEKFWNYFADFDQKPRLVCTELLFELNLPLFVQKCEWNVRQAKPEELVQIAEAHAQVAFTESGVNPLEKDREGFLKRTLKRIEKGRTFVVFENGRLVFKADIAAETAETAYLEGVYVSPEYRGQGIGSVCLSNLGLQLLDRFQNICLLGNKDFTGAHKSFMKAGFKNTDSCQTIFV